MNQNDIIEKVNKQVIDGLSKRGFDWFKTWKSGDANQPMNRASKTYYKGFNVFFLNAIMLDKNYEYNQWLTFKQCSDLNGKIKKGSKSVEVYLSKIGYQDMKTGKYLNNKQIKEVNLDEKFTTDNGNVIHRYRKTFYWTKYNVFNVSQCDGIEPIKIEVQENDNNPIEVAQDLTKSYVDRDGKLQVCHLFGDTPYYNKSTDVVNMPKMKLFCDSDSYYKVLFHELAHSTGHETRLNRKTLQEVEKFGDKSYAQEELVAEISSMYLVGLLDLNPSDSVKLSQAYIKGWCKNLADKPKECFFAMQQAFKVINYIQGK